MTDILFSGLLHRIRDFSSCTPRPDRLDPLRTRAGGRRLVHAHGLERLTTVLSRATVDLLLAGQVYSCFFKDAVGVAIIDRIGVDKVVFETDYPHPDGTWPHSARPQRSSSATSRQRS